MKPLLVQFDNAEGESLSARLDFPVDGRPAAFAIFAHCFTCSKSLRAVRIISSALAGAGIAVLQFDFTGLGQSEGEFSDSNFASNISDIVQASRWLTEYHGAPQILVGHSLGGAAVLHAASLIPSVRAVATIGAPYDPRHIRHHLLEDEEAINRTGEAVVQIGGRPFRIRKQFLDDLESHDSRETIHALRRALLIMHSPVDTIVGIDNAAKIFSAARHPKSFVSLDTADHLLRDPSDAMYAGSVLSAWARRYLDEVEEASAPSDTRERCVVTTNAGDRYRTDILANGHAIISDEPRSAGGQNTGPNPYDLLLSGLGSCTAITLRMYADRKNWPLERVSVSLSHRKVHSDDCECDADGRTGRLDVIERKISLVGALDEKQRERLVEIANKCPVHRTLTNEPVIQSELLPQGEEEPCGPSR